MPLVALIILSSCVVSKKKTAQKTDSVAVAQTTNPKQDTTKKNKIKPYKEIITEKAITDIGLFTIHKVDDRYFFEIPDSILNKDILIVSRISKAGTRYRPLQGMMGYAGDEIGERIVQFFKVPNNKIFIRRMNFIDRASDTTGNGMYQAVRNSNFLPIVASFDIKAFTPDSSASVIDITDFSNSDNDILYFENNVKAAFQLTSMQTDKSYINDIKSYPLNVEIKAVKTYIGESNTPVSYELNCSIVLLPANPMVPRNYDRRIGYFGDGYYDYDSPRGVWGIGMIARWRLEPKDEDIERYKRGELVAPKKPIVYYIDPATPKKWVPYLIQGVNDWQKAFEKAGFKNAIYAMEAPTNDSTWSLEDARHSVIVYKAAQIPNASGPNIHDPRTGEILETHINWYHYVMVLVHDWYMLQAGPSDSSGRKNVFNDKLMGELIRFVCSHEVGHTLGLMHNFGASSTIPVDSLRSKKYVEENGFCPSIMDYARFNYVAQPEDHISQKGLMPRIGVYDEWAIEWGYRWLPAFASLDEERAYMNHWITSRTCTDKRLWFGNEASQYDPRRQSEDLGDDAMKAGHYGIKNLKLVLNSLPEWTHQPNEDYELLKKMHEQVIGQYRRYIMHVANNIGGVMTNEVIQGDTIAATQFVPKEKQRAAVQFLHEELFNTPSWLKNEKVLKLTGRTVLLDPLNLQRRVLAIITSHDIIINLLRFQTSEPNKAYTFNELLQDLESGIWKELQTKSPINDLYRRNVQKIYAERLIELLMYRLGSEHDVLGGTNFYTDTYSILRENVRKLIAKINDVLPRYKDEMSRIHLIDIRNRLKQALDEKKEEKNVTNGPDKNAFNNSQLTDEVQETLPVSPSRGLKCWDDN